MQTDNGGYNTSPSPAQSQPIIASGDGATSQALTNGSAATNTTATVVAGARYRFTCTKTGAFLFGLATTATATNIRWVCGIGHSIEIQIPLGYTTLNYQTDTNDGYGWLVRIKSVVNEEPTE